MKIADYEATLDWSVPGMELGWCWRDTRIQPAVLSRLFVEGYLDNPFRSNSYTGYRLSEKGKLAVQGITEIAEEIANRLDGRSQDVRDAVSATRLAPQLGVEKAIKLLIVD